METTGHRIAFGPIPSRRLGRSLGINNIVTKTCSYSCVYCQVGPTTEWCVEPRAFFSPKQVRDAVARQLERSEAPGQGADYLTFVPDGEPTLDIALGESIEALREFGIPVAVVTNSSLLWREDIRARLFRADLVSVKVDTVDETAWRRVNRPHRRLELGRVMQGIRDFAAGYRGRLISETMLIQGINESAELLEETAEFLALVAPHTAYLAVPTRPVTVEGVSGADEQTLILAHEQFSARLANVELLTGHETGDFSHTGDALEDLLAVTAVHPMREAAVRRLLAKDHADWLVVEELLADGSLKSVEYKGERFYLRPVKQA